VYKIFIIVALFSLNACNFWDSTSNTATSPETINNVGIDADHRWTFDSDAADSGVVGGWDGVINGAATLSSTSAAYGAKGLLLSGSVGDNIDMGAQTLNSESTFAYWFISNDTTHYQHVIGTTNSSLINGINCVIFNFPSELYRIYLNHGDALGNESAQTNPGTTTLNSWNHVVSTWNNSTGAAVIYVNGVQEASTSLNGVTSPISGNLMVGESNGAYPFAGSIDEVLIYNRILDSTEVLNLYSSYSSLN
jgi:hypothetical protein